MECPPECCLACDHDYEGVQCVCGADEPKRSPGEQKAAWVAETCGLVASGLTWDVLPTQDGGFTIDTETPSGRDLLFAVPEEGTILYFTARGPGLRRAGIVTDDAAVAALARWVAGGVDFPVDGLLLG